MTSHRIATSRELPTLGDFKIEAGNAQPGRRKPPAGRRPIPAPRTAVNVPEAANDTPPLSPTDAAAD